MERSAGAGRSTTAREHEPDLVRQFLGKSGGARRDRTADLVNAIHALSQLSYGPNQKPEIRSQKSDWPGLTSGFSIRLHLPEVQAKCAAPQAIPASGYSRS